MELKEEQKYLKTLLNTAKKSLAGCPEGELHLSNSIGTVQYRYKGKYLSKKNISLIKQLAQKRYNRAFIKTAEKQLRLITVFESEYDKEALIRIPGEFTSEIQTLITPYVISDEEYAKQWKETEYGSKERDGIYITANGERVRSKSEVMIADRLLLNDIPYRYEETIQLNSGYRSIDYHPDFTVLNKRTRQEYYIEHFGIMDDTDYACNAVKKINSYAANGYIQGKNILYTFETSLCPLDMNTVDALIKNYLM